MESEIAKKLEELININKNILEELKKNNSNIFIYERPSKSIGERLRGIKPLKVTEKSSPRNRLGLL